MRIKIVGMQVNIEGFFQPILSAIFLFNPLFWRSNQIKGIILAPTSSENNLQVRHSLHSSEPDKT